MEADEGSWWVAFKEVMGGALIIVAIAAALEAVFPGGAL
jgi:hypothetical protein